ncbi:MAG TPA: rhomboid family intramembrane serine protease [Candidatus Nanoarchaeia archaeon]|nr:rhomboid family intramembrane serine protease [Candidatus Nanoarchaeia archaeon]
MERARRFALWLTGIMAGVFMLQQLFPAVASSFVLVSADAWSRPWTLFTAIFLHGGMAHILFNGLGLVMFGSVLEEIIGSRRFLIVFVTAGLVSSITSTFFYHSVVGASGAIFGVLGALTVLRPKMTVWVYYIPMPMYIAAAVWAITDLFGFVMPTNIANAGHLAGLATGIIAGFLIRGKQPLFSKVAGLGKKPILTAEEFDKWEEEHMQQGNEKRGGR